MARTDADEYTPEVENIDPATDYDSQAVEPEFSDTDSEDNVEGTGEEAPATDADEAAQAAELEAKIEASVEAFKSTALTTVEQADDEGHLTPDQLSPIVTAYRDVEGGNKGKKQARDFVTEQMKATLTSGAANGFQLAMAWNSVQDAIQTAPTKSSTGGGGKSSAPAVSQTQLFADKIAALRLGLQLAEANVPEGVDANWETLITGDEAKAQALLEFLSTEQADDATEPEASQVERAAVKYATGRGPRKAGRPSGTPYQGTRRDVAAHITNAFADKPSGTFLSIAEIKATPSQEYGSDSPSSGAISARLFPRGGAAMSVPGVEAANEGGKNGARKL